jgi:N-acetylglucosaminyldiphosphoundecaprenol N-acetyl-beta-D-mannosaminyltransferase
LAAINIDVRERLDVMRVPVDSLHPDHVALAVDQMVASDEVTQIVLVRWWDFMRARRDKRYRSILRDAGLVLPVSKSVAMASRFLRSVRPPRYMPFDFVIRTLGALEDRNRSIYILGGSPAALRTVEQNLRETFPGLRIVGRYTGGFSRDVEANIITAIRKAEPDLVFVGPGVAGGDRWISRHRTELPASICLESKDVFNVFAERRRRGSREAFRRGFDFLPDLLRRPWRIARFPVYLWFLLFLLIFRVFRL